MVNMMVRFKYSLALVVEEIIKEQIFTEICFFVSFPILGIVVIISKQLIENIDVFSDQFVSTQSALQTSIYGEICVAMGYDREVMVPNDPPLIIIWGCHSDQPHNDIN